MATATELRKKAKARRTRADKLWQDAPSIRVDRFKISYLNKVKRLYEEADKLDKQADKLTKVRR